MHFLLAHGWVATAVQQLSTSPWCQQQSCLPMIQQVLSSACRRLCLFLSRQDTSRSNAHGMHELSRIAPADMNCADAMSTLKQHDTSKRHQLKLAVLERHRLEPPGMCGACVVPAFAASKATDAQRERHLPHGREDIHSHTHTR